MENLIGMLGEIRGEMRARFDASDLRLNSIEEQTKKTNGRVTELEMDRERAIGARDAKVEVSVQQKEHVRRIEWWIATLIGGTGAIAGAAGAAVVILT